MPISNRVMMALGFAALAGSALAADVPGAKDPGAFKRFQGAEIIFYSDRSFDEYSIALGPGKPVDGFSKLQSVEGAVTRVLYRVPAGHTALEVFRNYEAMLKAQGVMVRFKTDPCGAMGWSGYFNGRFWKQSGITSEPPFDSATGGSCYLSASGVKGGKQTTVGLLVSEASRDFTFNLPGGKGKAAVKAGEVMAGFDVVVGQPVADQMVLVKAEDMARQLAASGVVDIYGVLFDVDQTAIKPESKATLDQVALLLKNDPKLNLEISGHTDNSGSADHNLKLSQGRAAAVVGALVKTYGVAATRLRSAGYGATKPVAGNDTEDGRAKNRRVELKKI